MKYLDTAHDVIIYTLILLCFIGAGYGIIQTMTGSSMLIETTALMGIGIATSAYFVWLKSKAPSDKHTKF